MKYWKSIKIQTEKGNKRIWLEHQLKEGRNKQRDYGIQQVRKIRDRQRKQNKLTSRMSSRK